MLTLAPLRLEVCRKAHTRDQKGLTWLVLMSSDSNTLHIWPVSKMLILSFLGGVHLWVSVIFSNWGDPVTVSCRIPPASWLRSPYTWQEGFFNSILLHYSSQLATFCGVHIWPIRKRNFSLPLVKKKLLSMQYCHQRDPKPWLLLLTGLYSPTFAPWFP